MDAACESRIVNLSITCAASPEEACEVAMMEAEMKAFPDQVMQAVSERARGLLADRPLKRFTYRDDEGDECTLTAATLEDALLFASESGMDAGMCRLEVVALAEAPEAAAAPPPPTASLPEPEAAPAPSAPEEAPQTPPPPPTSTEELEVHVCVCCDGCNQAPILGKRYKCTDCHNYDLCERCYKRNKVDRSMHPHDAFERIESPVRGEVVQSYYASPAANSGESCHHYIICDGCEASPIVGSRFKCTTVPNYDLCRRCYENRAQISPHADQPFEELLVCPVACPRQEPSKPAAEAAEAQEQPAEPKCPAAAALTALAASLDGPLCSLAVRALLEHPDARLREAAAAAASAAGLELEKPAAPAKEQEQPQEEPQEQPEEQQQGAKATPGEEPMAVDAEKSSTEKEPAPEAAQPVAPTWSASVLSAAQLVLGVEASEDEAARGDVSEEFAGMLQSLGAHQAFRCGRVLLPTSQGGSTVPAEAKVIMVNDGAAAWPEATCLSVVAGDALGLSSLALGSLQPGEAAELILDLGVPQKAAPGVMRSAWSMMDAATGAAFGPLLFFEVVWAEP